MKNFTKKIGLNSFNLFLVIFLLVSVTFSIITVVNAAAPNPGHTWAEIGDAPWTKSSSYLYTSTLTDSVGIGTATPGLALDVNEGGFQIGGVSNTLSTNTSNKMRLGKYNSGAAPYAIYGVIQTPQNHGIAVWNEATGVIAAFGSDAAGSTQSYFGGNVGIGTTGPGAKLTVSGSAAVSPAASAMQFIDTAGNANSRDWQISNGGLAYGSLTFSSNNDSAHATGLIQHRLTIDKDGNVGIGITPTTKLDVNGVINVNDNKITGLATPTTSTDAATKDYVDAAASGSGNMTSFTTAGANTWTRPAGVNMVWVTMVAGGGGGSGNGTIAAGGGGGQSFFRYPVPVSGDVTVTVAAGGGGGGGGAGVAGGNSIFAGDITLTALGGKGGPTGSATGGNGGGARNGSSAQGTAGKNDVANGLGSSGAGGGSGGAAGGDSSFMGGSGNGSGGSGGGATPFGGGGNGSLTGVVGGAAAANTGGGGGGGGSGGGGGAGGTGLVIVEW